MIFHELRRNIEDETQQDFYSSAMDRLHIFTFRQLEENVFLRSGSLTISSVLVLIAIACMSYGVSVASANLESGRQHTMDFTLEAWNESSERLRRIHRDLGT